MQEVILIFLIDSSIAESEALVNMVRKSRNNT